MKCCYYSNVNISWGGYMVNIWAVIICALGAFVLSTVWYIIFAKARAGLLGFKTQPGNRPSPKLVLVELLRTFLVALVFAIIFAESKSQDMQHSLLLGLRLFLAFPFVLLLGSSIWDKVPPKLALIHACDWFIKLIFIALVIGGLQ
jgi:hypothetical protein